MGIIQLRRDTAANWAAANPILAEGEAGYAVDTQVLKLGNGSYHWTSLDGVDAAVAAALAGKLDADEVGTTVAGLGLDGRVPAENLPPATPLTGVSDVPGLTTALAAKPSRSTDAADTGKAIDAYTGQPLPVGGSGDGLSVEEVRDLVAGFVRPGSGVTVAHDDAGDTLTISSTGGAAAPVTTATQLTTSPTNMSRRLAASTTPTFAGAAGLGPKQVTVDVSKTYQRMFGVGGSLTESSAYVLSRLTVQQRHDLLVDLFDPRAGLGFQCVRLCMGASDFIVPALGEATYDDDPAIDPALPKFSLERDDLYVVPVLREILVINPAIVIFACPWTAPAKIKSNGALRGGSLKTDAASLNYWAAYFVRYVQEMTKRGFRIDYLSPQNEPGITPSNYPGMLLSASAEATFVGSYLGPALDAAGIHAKILCHEDYADATYANQVLANTDANAFTAGVAFHGYGNDPDNQRQVTRRQPTKEVHFTEWCAAEANTFEQSHNLFAGAIGLIGRVREGAQSLMLWNLCLYPGAEPSNGSCDAIVQIDEQTGAVFRQAGYYALAHHARAFKPGAVRIRSAYDPSGISTVAYRNPDGSRGLVAYNQTTMSNTVVVQDAENGASTLLTLAAKEMCTLTWEAAPAMAAGTIEVAPVAPTALTATAATDAVSVTLVWTDAPTASAYVLSRTTGAADTETPLAVIPAGGSYRDDRVIVNTAYRYKLISLGSGGQGAATASVGPVTPVTPPAPPAPPATPGYADSASGAHKLSFVGSPTSVAGSSAFANAASLATGSSLKTTVPTQIASTWTVEARVKRLALTAAGQQNNILQATDTSASMTLWLDAAQKLCIYTTDGARDCYLVGNSGISDTTTEHHVEATFDGTQVRLFVDGNLVGSAALSSLYTGLTASALAIGAGIDGTSPINAIVDEVRVSSVARHTGSFTAPTAPHVVDANTVALWHLDTVA